MRAQASPIGPSLPGALVLALAGVVSRAPAADRPQWGEKHTRNMVSEETGLPDDFDPATGRNVKWTAPLGTETYGSPVIARGRVFVGTNNKCPRDERHRGDRGVLLCLDEEDGRLLWQLVVPKLEGDVYLDWPGAGHCSPPTVEGERVYVVSNRAEVMCLDIEGMTDGMADGMADGNDGPYRDEGRHMTPLGSEPMEPAANDADIVWLFDMRAEVGVYPHDTAHASILVDGPFLYVNTGNGVDNTHRRIRSPGAPSLIVIEKETGRLVARDAERIGPRVFHCTWSSPSIGRAGGARLVFYAGADAVCYAFEPLAPDNVPERAVDLERAWSLDCDPGWPKENIHTYVGNRREGPSTIHAMPVLHEGRLYVTVGGDVWWGKRRSWLKCIDPSSGAAGGEGDGAGPAEVWSYELERASSSTPSVRDGLVYVADCGRRVHCVDAATGLQRWTHRTGGEIWGSTLVADGKVYIGTLGRDFVVFAAGGEKRVLASLEMDSGIATTPAAANGVLYVATMRRLYALAREGE